MVSLNALILLAAVAAPPDAVLLNFSADWCGHCRTMAPVVQRLETDGFPVRHINVDRERPLATRYRVTGVPAYVLLVDGKEVGRLEGATSYDRLVQLLRAAEVQPAKTTPLAANAARVVKPAPAPAPIVRGQSPETKSFGLPALGKLGSIFDRKPADDSATKPAPADPFAARGAAPAPNQPASDTASSAAQAALRATVRLRVDDAKGQSIGTGTIIDTHEDEALIVTCGHIFRDSQGKGPIFVDLFVPGAGKPVAGQLVGYDLDRDVGLVSIRPGLPVRPMRVAPADFAVARGQKVFSVGCDRGGPPSVLDSRVTAINRYIGPPNIEVAGQPVDGRSGGGLFSADGYLIGICNAADPADKEGIYAALATVQWQLDQLGLQYVYQSSPAAANVGDVVTNDTPADSPAAPPVNAPRMNAVPPLTNVGLRDRTSLPATSSPTPSPPANSRGDDKPDAGVAGAETSELICIVRNPNGGSDVFLLDRVPRELLERLSRDGRPVRLPDVNAGANARDPSRSNAATPLDRRSPFERDRAERGPVIRGQLTE